MKFDTTSPTSRGVQTWRFCLSNLYGVTSVSDNDHEENFKHYIEIFQSEKSPNSDKMVSKNVCLRFSDKQLIAIKEIIDAYFEEGKE